MSAYNVRGKYTNQAKYSNKGFNQMLDLIKVKAADTLYIEEQVQKRLDKVSKAGDIGMLGNILKLGTGISSNKIDDWIFGTAEAAYLDHRASNARGGIDTSKVQYLGDAAKNIDLEVKELSKKYTEDLKFGNRMKDLGLDVAFDVIKDSEGWQKFEENMKTKWSEATEDYHFGEGKVIDFIKDGTQGLLDQFKAYGEDPVEYSKKVKKFKNPELYKDNDEWLQLALMSFLQGGNESWLENILKQYTNQTLSTNNDSINLNVETE
tara:strand:- start:1791 stop:2582 length:792 start_codon:yes stop_codon:yes gene_type:complete